jgi:hypothetical protein
MKKEKREMSICRDFPAGAGIGSAETSSHPSVYSGGQELIGGLGILSVRG